MDQDLKLKNGEFDPNDFEDSQDDNDDDGTASTDGLGGGEYLKQEDFPIVTKQMKDYFDDINLPPI